MNICFFISGLRAAGAERVMSILASAWIEKGWQVTILTMEDGRQKPFYPLHDSVKVLPLDLLKESTSLLAGMGQNINRVRNLRRAIKEVQPDVLISFIDRGNSLAVLAAMGLNIPVVISERTDPSRRSLGLIWNALRDFTYPRADAVVFQSKGVMNWFPERVRSRGVVIPNPISLPPDGAQPAHIPDSPPLIVALGRLVPIKGFDILLAAFAEANKRVPGWNLQIWGQGVLLDSLQAQAANLGLSGQVAFMGVTNAPFDVLRTADLFVMPSRTEGFPNALVEAMACGLPVISTDFGGAAKDIIRDGVDGVLVPSEDSGALADALSRLMKDPGAREGLAARAPEVLDRFSIERVLELWENTVQRVLNAKRQRISTKGR